MPNLILLTKRCAFIQHLHLRVGKTRRRQISRRILQANLVQLAAPLTAASRGCQHKQYPGNTQHTSAMSAGASHQDILDQRRYGKQAFTPCVRDIVCNKQNRPWRRATYNQRKQRFQENPVDRN